MTDVSSTLNSVRPAWYVRYWRELALLALPILITLVNPNWLYNPDALNKIDQWIYNGLFRYFPDFATNPVTSQYYFTERLGWVLPGYILYQIFTPEVANIILDLGLYYLTLFSLYGIAKRLWGDDAAFVMALCLGGYTWFLRAIGDDYLDGVGIAYYSVALWFATHAVYHKTPRYKYLLVGFGAFLALALTTQLTWIFLIPVAAIYVVVLNYHVHRHPLIRCITASIIGACGVLLILMGVHWLVTQNLNMFEASIITTRLIGQSAKEFREAVIIAYRPIPPTWLVMPMVIALGVCVVLTHSQRLRVSRYRIVGISGIFTVNLLVFVGLHWFTPSPYLIIYLYMSMSIPVTFLTFSGLIATRDFAGLSPHLGLIGVGLAVLSFGLVVMFAPLETALSDSSLTWLFILVCLGAALYGFGYRSMWLIVGGFVFASMGMGVANGTVNHNRLQNYQLFTSVNQTIEAIEQALPRVNYSQLHVWYDSTTYRRYASPFVSIYWGGTKWKDLQAGIIDGEWGYENTNYAVMLTDKPDIQQQIQTVVGSLFDIELLTTFQIPSVDPTGQYRGLVFRLHKLTNVTAP